MNKNIEIRELKKKYGEKVILKGFDMDIPIGGFLSLLGPSGAGKTTFLRIVAGILAADSGTVSFPPDIDQSPVLVFQDYQLFPYMSVYNNIAFGLQTRHVARKEIENHVKEMAGKLGILDRLSAYPAQLSGGEKQRCALARALVLNPQILLLDEPFANLDKNLKRDTARLLKRIQQEFKLTLISVTHEQEEAIMLSDAIALIIEGELKEFGVAEQIYRRPKSIESARFLGQVNCIPVLHHEYFQIDEQETVYCRPENLEIHRETKGEGNIEERTFDGRVYKYLVRLRNILLEVISMEEDLLTGDIVNIDLKEYFVLPSLRGKNKEQQ